MHRVSEQDRSRNQISRTRREARFLLAVSLAVGAFLRHKLFSFNRLEREARVGIEPTHTAFAEPRLTTWLPRLIRLRTATVLDSFRLRQAKVPGQASARYFPRAALRCAGFVKSTRAGHRDDAHSRWARPQHGRRRAFRHASPFVTARLKNVGMDSTLPIEGVHFCFPQRRCHGWIEPPATEAATNSPTLDSTPAENSPY
jgi:hypothetical protein